MLLTLLQFCFYKQLHGTEIQPLILMTGKKYQAKNMGSSKRQV